MLLSLLCQLVSSYQTVVMTELLVLSPFRQGGVSATSDVGWHHLKNAMRAHPLAFERQGNGVGGDRSATVQ